MITYTPRISRSLRSQLFRYNSSACMLPLFGDEIVVQHSVTVLWWSPKTSFGLSVYSINRCNAPLAPSTVINRNRSRSFVRKECDQSLIRRFPEQGSLRRIQNAALQRHELAHTVVCLGQQLVFATRSKILGR